MKIDKEIYQKLSGLIKEMQGYMRLSDWDITLHPEVMASTGWCANIVHADGRKTGYIKLGGAFRDKEFPRDELNTLAHELSHTYFVDLRRQMYRLIADLNPKEQKTEDKIARQCEENGNDPISYAMVDLFPEAFKKKAYKVLKEFDVWYDKKTAGKGRRRAPARGSVKEAGAEGFPVGCCSRASSRLA